MNVQEAVITFSQSDKIKSGIIWVSQAVELLPNLPETETHGAERMIKLFINMIHNEVNLAHKLGKEDEWKKVEKHFDTALVMINSGVAYESAFHLTQALSQTTSISHRAMTVLKDENLI